MQELGPLLLLGEGEGLLPDVGVDAVALGELEEEDGEAVAGEGAEEVEQGGAGLGPGGGDEGVLYQLEEPAEDGHVAKGVADLVGGGGGAGRKGGGGVCVCVCVCLGVGWVEEGGMGDGVGW